MVLVEFGAVLVLSIVKTSKLITHTPALRAEQSGKFPLERLEYLEGTLVP